MESLFKKRFVVAYFDSTGSVDFYHGTDIDGVPRWGCYADARRMSVIDAYRSLKSLGDHSGHVRVLTFAQALDAIFSQACYSEACEYCDDPDFISEYMLTEEEL